LTRSLIADQSPMSAIVSPAVPLLPLPSLTISQNCLRDNRIALLPAANRSLSFFLQP